MQIIYKRQSQIKPYEANAKKHPQKQIAQIAKSISEFGFNDPIAIDEQGIILEGHGRYQALCMLGIDEIPCVVISGLSDEQKKAYNLTHNKLTMNSGFDMKMLKTELNTIKKFDMQAFGFDLKKRDYYGDERERTFDAYNMNDVDNESVTGAFDMPQLMPCYHVPRSLIGFNYMLTSKEFDSGIHFYIDDYQFERIWQNPHAYTERLKMFDCCLTPDFSLYTDMPLAMQIWNVYRSRLIGQIMQACGIDVIPTVSWSDSRSFQFCYDGLPHNAVLSISTIGVKRNKESMNLWQAGVLEMIKRLTPQTLIVYGGVIRGAEYGKTNVVHIDNKVTKAWKGEHR